MMTWFSILCCAILEVSWLMFKTSNVFFVSLAFLFHFSDEIVFCLEMFPGFQHPFSCVIAGPSQSGKTVFLRKLLKGAHLFIDEAPERIVWAHGAHNDEQLNSIKKGAGTPIEFVEGLPDLNIFLQINAIF